MADKRDYYDVLGVSKSADDAEIKNPNEKIYFNTQTTWGNTLGAIHWNYKFNKGDLNQSIYFSGYRNRLSLTGNYDVRLPSEIYDIGYRSKLTFNKWETGLSIINHNTTPQAPEHANSSIVISGTDNEQHTIEGSIYAKYGGNIFNDIYYDVALKGNLYFDFKGYTHTSLNPYAMIAYDTRKAGRIEFSYSHQHQYLMNCGFTSIGMPVEFWISADAKNRPQYAHNFQLSYRRDIFNGDFEISADAYYKKLYNQVEYNASPLDMLNKEYSLENIIIRGNGYNYGAKAYDRVTKVLKITITLATIVTTLAFVIGEFCPGVVARIFTSDEKMIEMAVVGMRYNCLLFPIVGFQMVAGNFFQSIAQPGKSIFLSLSRQLLFLVPFIIIFPHFWGINGVWISLPASDFISAIFSGFMKRARGPRN